MKVLLDNCVPYRLKRLLTEHAVSHAKDERWSNLENGKLLAAAADAGFDVFITVDKKIKFEQNLNRLPLPIIEIDTADIRLPAIAAITAQINQAISLVAKSRFISIGSDGTITTT